MTATALELSDYLRFFAALVFVLALIGLAGWLARRYGLGGTLTGPAAARRRLGVIEALPLDARRRLVLVRRDQVEHLLLLGPNDDVVIEAGIPAADPQAQPAGVEQGRTG